MKISLFLHELFMEHRGHEEGTAEHGLDLQLQALQSRAADLLKQGQTTDLNEVIKSARIQLSQGTYTAKDAEELIAILDKKL